MEGLWNPPEIIYWLRIIISLWDKGVVIYISTPLGLKQKSNLFLPLVIQNHSFQPTSTEELFYFVTSFIVSFDEIIFSAIKFYAGSSFMRKGFKFFYIASDRTIPVLSGA